MQTLEGLLTAAITARSFIRLTHETWSRNLLVLPRALARRPSGVWLLSQEVEDKGAYALLDRWRTDRLFFGLGVLPADEQRWKGPLAPVPAEQREQAGEIFVESSD